MLFTKNSQLTGLISSLGQTYDLNSGVWCHSNDVKVAWGYITVAAASATLNYGNGIASVAREADGIVTATYSSVFDSQPAVVVGALGSSGAVDSQAYAIVEDGTSYTHSTSGQTVVRYNADGGTRENGDIFFLAVGVDAGTTLISDNSANTPLTPGSLNRFVAMGNYRNPSQLDDTIFVLSAGYTTTTANPGDTMTNVTNIDTGNHTRTGAGDYDTDFSVYYIVPPIAALCSVICADGTCGYAASSVTVDNVVVKTTDGTDDTEADRNYSLIVLGEMEVS